MARIAIAMPKMSMTMDSGIIVSWEVGEGTPVHAGDVLVIVTTDKVDMEVESTADGVLVEILAAPEAVVPVGETIGYIESDTAELLGGLFDKARPAEAVSDDSPLGTGTGKDMPKSSCTDRVFAVPLARRLAADAGIDLATIPPSGPGHTIRARDVRQAAAQLATAPQAGEPSGSAQRGSAQRNAAETARQEPADGGTERQLRVRLATAAIVTAGSRIPQFTAYRTLDVSRVAAARKGALRNIGWTTLLTRAYAMTLAQFPALNGTWTDMGITTNDHVVISIAVDTPVGLVAPTVTDPHLVSLRSLDESIRKLVSSARSSSVMTGSAVGTGTLSNLGVMGVDRFNALLTPPQVTALSVGCIRRVPVFTEDGGIIPGLVCDAGLTIDHRAADGADAARALQTMQSYLHDVVLLLA